MASGTRSPGTSGDWSSEATNAVSLHGSTTTGAAGPGDAVATGPDGATEGDGAEDAAGGSVTTGTDGGEVGVAARQPATMSVTQTRSARRRARAPTRPALPPRALIPGPLTPRPSTNRPASIAGPWFGRPPRTTALTRLGLPCCSRTR